jgi:hypothetical protein
MRKRKTLNETPLRYTEAGPSTRCVRQTASSPRGHSTNSFGLASQTQRSQIFGAVFWNNLLRKAQIVLPFSRAITSCHCGLRSQVCANQPARSPPKTRFAVQSHQSKPRSGWSSLRHCDGRRPRARLASFASIAGCIAKLANHLLRANAFLIVIFACLVIFSLACVKSN